jgi:hypothetical protein
MRTRQGFLHKAEHQQLPMDIACQLHFPCELLPTAHFRSEAITPTGQPTALCHSCPFQPAYPGCAILYYLIPRRKTKKPTNASTHHPYPAQTNITMPQTFQNIWLPDICGNNMRHASAKHTLDTLQTSLTAVVGPV